MIKLIIYTLSIIFMPTAFAQELPQEESCRNGGAIVIGNLHMLDFCITHRKINPNDVQRIKQLISDIYPKISNELENNSELSLSMRRISLSLPYDFDDSTNAALLTNICDSSIRFMHKALDTEWQKTLSCWR